MDTVKRIFIKILKGIVLLVLILFIVELVCVVLSLPVVVIIKAEQAYEAYPLISEETISLKRKMQKNYENYHDACKENGDLYSSVEKRKELAQKAGFSIYTSLLLRTAYATHSRWICGTDGTVSIITDLNPLK